MSASRVHIASEPASSWLIKLRCSECGQALSATNVLAACDVRCQCGFALRHRDGILRALSAERDPYFRRFATEYGKIRALEGRGAKDDDYYLALPFEDRTGRNAWQWSIRSKTYSYFASRILEQIESRNAKPLNVLDVGAGNGWLSYRLTMRGHHCAAVDLLDNDWDGLGAANRYFAHLAAPFALVQAEMDRIPFADDQFDLVIFNASFHYSTDYSRTVCEALRLLRTGGSVLVFDTPYYHRESSGAAMVREREADFERRYGFRSNSIPSSEFISRYTLDRLERGCGVRWKVLKPWYGWNWALRPWKARIRRRREPSKFYIFWGTTEA